MAWMTRWPGSFPIFFDTANGAHFTDVDGLDYIDFCLGDTGAMTGHGLPQVAEALYAQALRGITTMLPSVDAAWVGAELARRFGLPVWQMAMTATDANRFVLRFARHLTGRRKVLVFDWCYHGTVDEALATLDADGRTISRPGNLGAAGRSVRRRRSSCRSTISPRSRPRWPPATSPACWPSRRSPTSASSCPSPASTRRSARLTRAHGTLLVIDETHTICVGPGGCNRGVGPPARLLRDRQDDRWRHAGRRLRHDRRDRRASWAPMIAPGGRRQRRRRHADRQRAGAGRGAGHA